MSSRRLVAAVVLVASAVSGCGMRTVTDVPAPEKWSYLSENGESSEIELFKDGEGLFTSVPVGVFEDCPDGAEVVAVDGGDLEVWSGEVAWRNGGDGQVIIESALGDAAIWSDLSGFGGDLPWSQISVPVCDTESGELLVLRYFSFPSTSSKAE